MYYEDAEVTPVYTSAEDLLKKANPTGKGRVVLVPPVEEFLGNRENWHFTRRYATHVETWLLMPMKGLDAEYCKSFATFQARDGEYFTMWHEFHHTVAESDEAFLEASRTANTLQEALWQVIL